MNQASRLFVLLLALLLLPAGARAQGAGTITGQVVDATTGQPLAGAQIFLAGTTRGSLTNQQGRFLIPGIPAGQHEVRATLIGYSQGTQRVTLAAGQSATADFRLQPSAVELGAVVVTATGREQRAREIGNAVSTINADKVEMSAVNNMASLIQGRSAGVTVMQSGGTTGSGARIRIRGSNSVSLSNEPLLIIDGVRATNDPSSITVGTGGQSPSRLNDINPEDIESIEILKGPAAAAMYGTAAANGVIQITTKRGRAGAARWTAYTEQGTIVEPNEYLENVAEKNSGYCAVVEQGLGRCTLGELVRFNPLENPETTPFRDGYRQKYGASVSGGGDVTTYYVSGEFDREQGIFEINKLNQINVRTNVNSRITEKLNLSVKAGYINSDIHLPQNDNNFGGVHLNGNLGWPDTTATGAGGYYLLRPSEFFEFQADQQVHRLTGGVNANYQPLSWLSLVATSGLDLVNRHDEAFIRPNAVTKLSANVTAGNRRSNRIEQVNITNTLDATGRFTLRQDLVSTTSTGVQHYREEYHDTRGFGVGVVPGTRSLGGTTRLFEVGENTIENATFGSYVQQQLAWRDRVYLTGSLRGDQNSAFGTDIGFVTYPSLSTSWVVSEEPFFPETNLLNNLRLRAAYGKSGLRPSFRDAFTFFEPVAARVTGSDAPAITLAGTGNPALRPEIATELEVGFDAGLLGDRLGLELTYFNKQSKDALIRRRLAPSLGATTTRFENIGSVENTGWEALVNAQLANSHAFQMDATLTLSTTRNKLLQLGEGVEPIFLGFSNGPQIHKEGFPLGGYWNRRVLYEDKNGDGFLNPDTEVTRTDTMEYLGTPFPTREASFTSNFTLFNLVRVSGLLDYKGGHKLLNFTRMDRCAWEMLCEETYVKEKATLKDQAQYIAWNYLGRNTEPFIEDADFVKLRELSLSFAVPENLIRRFGTNGARVTLSGRNLATWTKYSGYDPEVNTFGQRNFDTADYHNQPPVRFYTIRFDVNF